VSNTKPPIIPCVHLSLLFFAFIILSYNSSWYHSHFSEDSSFFIFYFFYFFLFFLFFLFTRCNTSRISAEKIEKNSLSSTVLLVVQLYYFGLYSSSTYPIHVSYCHLRIPNTQALIGGYLGKICGFWWFF
jgi:hypothetical protein